MNNLFEGMDIDYLNHIVSYNPNHEKAVITGNEEYNPLPIYDSIKSLTTGQVFQTISIFIRLKDKRIKGDGNPVLYAWKGYDEWKFNSESDKSNLIRQFKKITKEFNKPFDTIIQVPSSNKMNNEIADLLIEVLGKKKVVKNFIQKIEKDRVINYLDLKMAQKDGENPDYIMDVFEDAMEQMPTDFFQFHFLPSKYRKYMRNCFGEVPKSAAVTYAPFINGKRVLIIDDTISSGQTISSFCKVLLGTFDPKEALVFTAFSKLYKKNDPRVKNCLLHIPKYNELFDF